MAIESPCTLVCTMDPISGLCLGCARTLDEIASWSGFTAETRQTITEDLPARRDGLAKRRRELRANQSKRPRTAVSADAP